MREGANMSVCRATRRVLWTRHTLDLPGVSRSRRFAALPELPMDADIAALEAGGLAPEDEFEMDEAMEDELFYGGAPMEAETMDAAAPPRRLCRCPRGARARTGARAAPPAPARYTIPVPTEDGELAMVRVLEARPRPKSAATDKAGSLLGRRSRRCSTRSTASARRRGRRRRRRRGRRRRWRRRTPAGCGLTSTRRARSASCSRRTASTARCCGGSSSGTCTSSACSGRRRRRRRARRSRGASRRRPSHGRAGARRRRGGDAAEKQILLISGPPGLGKTTLAHVAARHAGYRPLEINASDERSAKVMRARQRGDRRPGGLRRSPAAARRPRRDRRRDGRRRGLGRDQRAHPHRERRRRAAAAATAVTTTTAPAAAAARRRALRGCSGR